MRWTTGSGRPAHLAFAFLVATLTPNPAFGQAPPNSAAPHPPVITHHVGTFNGKQVSYTATVEGIDVPNLQGKLAARVVSFAYVADNMDDPSTRPVLFAFNGGPITASIWLHLGILGPKRVAVPDDLAADPATYQLVDNAYSPLDATDLVLVDPASTGYSRVLPGTAPQSYYSVVADGQQITAFIAAWLARHDRLSSPVYLLGESYGTMRAAEVAGQLAELPHPILADGVILLGQALNIIEFSQRPQNILSYVVSLPTIAALAWYHRKVDRQGKTVEQFADDAWRFAETEYLTALFQGSAIDPAERDRVAGRLEQLTGIPAAYYSDHDLRITKEQYRGELFKDRGLLLGRSDGRYLAPITSKGLAEDPSSIIDAPFKRLFDQYLRDELKVDWQEEYIPIAPVGGLDHWQWGATTPFSDWPYSNLLLKVMNANPRFHVLVANGYYDTQTTVGAAEYLVRDAGWPARRATLAFYEGGHAAYTAEPAGKQFTQDVRHFISRSP
ncbi:MAG TPA: hypothetical protein VGS20_03445 [Candidatus Acidoferrales bacterium]|nr:hypothetical protein [Candidatus Acidoferrales bacterium]